MTTQLSIPRAYLPQTVNCATFNDIQPFYDELQNRTLTSVTDLQKWMADRSELECFVQEHTGWLYIRMTCDATNEALSEAFNYFVNEIDPLIAPYNNGFNIKLTQSPFLKELSPEKYAILLRSTAMAIQLFREENIPLHAQIQTLQNNYGNITSQMSIEHEGKELTLQQAATYFKNTNRALREAIYNAVNIRRLQDKTTLDELYTQLISLRHNVAQNAGYANYRDYKFDELNRFDYNLKDVEEMHASVAKYIKPIVEQFDVERKAELGYTSLQPWDMDVDTQGATPPKPFTTGEDLVNKTIACFNKIDPQFAEFITIMRDLKYLDVESRKGKAPGGYNYPLYESNIPFIFMNAVGTMRDVETMVHEGGHAIHSILSAGLELVDFKNIPSEVAELASMSMELIAMEHIETFVADKDQLKRLKIEQLQSCLQTLTWVCTIDKFQHWIYTHPTHTLEERTAQWIQVFEEFNTSKIEYAAQEGTTTVAQKLSYKQNAWQKQLHLYEVPFYYIEYGMAQLGAIAMWRQYKQNPAQCIANYKAALALGYTKSIPEIYATAGIEFNFSSAWINELAGFVNDELAKIKAS
ncbi:MAG: M3 family oligoendopeptidase [Bacteroidia bacterium]